MKTQNLHTLKYKIIRTVWILGLEKLIENIWKIWYKICIAIGNL